MELSWQNCNPIITCLQHMFLVRRYHEDEERRLKIFLALYSQSPATALMTKNIFLENHIGWRRIHYLIFH